MKDLLYRLPISRSLTRLLWILTFAVVAFAALELLFVQPALASVWCCNNTTKKCICDASLACPSNFPSNSFKQCGVVGKVVDQGTINSNITCTGFSDGAINWDSTSVARTGILYCDVTGSLNNSHDGKAFCQLDLSYSRLAGLQTLCTPVPNSNPAEFTLTHQAFCDQVSGGNSKTRLTVTGTLKCNSPDVQELNSNTPDPVNMPVDLLDGIPKVCGGSATPCTLNLGIAGQGNQCSTLFQFLDGDTQDPPVPDLAVGQVLRLVRTFDNVSCMDPPTAVSGVATRYCSGASFNGSPVDCTFGSGKTQTNATIIGTADNALVFDVDFLPPTTLNVGCPNNPNDPPSNNSWDFTIFGNEQLDVTLIDAGSLRIEGALPNPPITCKPSGNNTVCLAQQTCPNVAAAVKAARDPDTKEVDITVTGTLTSGTPIIGQQHIQTSGD
jgi:hypothetical protein